MRHKVSTLAIYCLIFCLISCASSLAQFVHPDLKSGKKHIRTLLLMPVQVNLTRVSMKGAEPMMEESRQTEQDLRPVIAGILQELGYKLDQDSLGPAVLAQDSDLRYTVDDVQKRFDAELERMNHKAKDVRKGRFSLGDEVVKLPEVKDVDALLFVRTTGQVLTGGKRAFGILVAGAKFDTVFMRFGVVDARTGDVLYFARPLVLRNIANDPDKAANAIKKSFKNFAEANPAEQPSSATKNSP